MPGINLEQLQCIGNAVSAVAIVVSLIYLSFQIRQAEKYQRALMQQGRVARISAAAESYAHPAIAEAINRGWDGARDISPVQLRQFSFVCRQLFIGAEDSFLQHQDSLLNEAAYRSCLASTKAYLSSPGVRAMWRLTRDWYEPGFRSFMEQLLKGVRAAPSDGLAQWQAAVAEQPAEVRNIRAVHG
ncbi:MAG TPA: hypothetical protein VHW69_01840 [Rhizomicrobium sp.]|jgi:hypothetical protein|nr:hypothetical protein [Rhizomicrobium sp.]